MNQPFELIAFFSNIEDANILVKSGIDGIIVDWERKGKELRQQLYNTQVNQHSKEDLNAVSKLEIPNIICRLNPQSKVNSEEIITAIDLGANEIIIPMVRLTREVENVLEIVQDRAKTSIMLETTAGIAAIDQLNKLPLERIYIGLNDLSIELNSRNLFGPVTDGMLDTIRPKISNKFGFGGLTHPQMGSPIPCKVLIEEMKRLGATYGILRRSFYKDALGHTIPNILYELRKEFSDYTYKQEHIIEVSKNSEIMSSAIL